MLRALPLLFAFSLGSAALAQDEPPAPLVDRVVDPEDELAAETFDTPRFDRYRALIGRAVIVRAPDESVRVGVLINIRADAVVLEESGGVKVDIPAALVADVTLDAAEIGSTPREAHKEASPSDARPSDAPPQRARPDPPPVNSADDTDDSDDMMTAGIWAGAGGAALVVGTIGTLTALYGDLGDLQGGTLICCGTTGLFGCAVLGFGGIKLLEASRKKTAAESQPPATVAALAVPY